MLFSMIHIPTSCNPRCSICGRRTFEDYWFRRSEGIVNYITSATCVPGGRIEHSAKEAQALRADWTAATSWPAIPQPARRVRAGNAGGRFRGRCARLRRWRPGRRE